VALEPGRRATAPGVTGGCRAAPRSRGRRAAGPRDRGIGPVPRPGNPCREPTSREAIMPRARALRPLALAVALAAAAVLGAPAPAGADDPERYRDYYRIFDRGPAKIPGADTSLVPQGLTYWVARDA